MRGSRVPLATSHSRHLARLLACAAWLWCGVGVAAPSVFLNGVNIDGVTDQKFENVGVEIDRQGNVLITAPGYRVKTVGTATDTPAAQKTATAPVTRRYFMVSETNVPGMTQYDVDVFVNSVWVKRISGEERQTVTEITRHLRRGRNVVQFTATKNLGAGRKSASAQHYLKLIVGEGNIAGNNVMIDNPILEYRRDASESKNLSNDFEVTGR